MANLKDKMHELAKHVRDSLSDAVGYATETDKFKDYEAALKEVKSAERKLRAVQSHVRSHMRRTKEAFQSSCPHTNKVDTRVHQMADGKRVVEFQACTNCSKVFDLRELVS